MENIYLTDEQYLEVLHRGLKNLNKIKKVEGVDSTTIGDKYTETNVGLCNNALTTKETALWPDEFPNRDSMKYSEKHHSCPLDWRSKDEIDGNGCFFTCMFFKRNLRDLSQIKQLYKERIKEAEQCKNM